MFKKTLLSAAALLAAGTLSASVFAAPAVSYTHLTLPTILLV